MDAEVIVQNYRAVHKVDCPMIIILLLLEEGMGKMKKMLCICLSLCLSLLCSACKKNSAPDLYDTELPLLAETEEHVNTETALTIENESPKPPFEGKIAIITDELMGTSVFFSARPIIEKYGDDKIIHVAWPLSAFNEPEEMMNTVAKLSYDPDIKVIIVNRAFWRTSDVFKKLYEIRKDIFIIFCEPELYFGNNYPQTADSIIQIADLALKADYYNMGSAIAQQAYKAIAQQAYKMGAKTFVYYYSEYHQNSSYNNMICSIIRQNCKELDIKFIDAVYPQIEYNVQTMIKKHGKNTAFFSLSTIINDMLVMDIIDHGAICPQTGLSIFVLFSESSHMDMTNNHRIQKGLLNYFETEYLTDIMGKPYPAYSKQLMDLARPFLARYDMLGRLSAKPVRADYMFTIIAADYAVKWINGEVPREGVDVEVLKQLMEEFAGVEVFLTPYTDEYPYNEKENEKGSGRTYDNFLMMQMDFITFE